MSSTLKFEPTGDRVFCLNPKKKEERTEAGVVIPETVQSQSVDGMKRSEVIAVSVEASRFVGVGDTVIHQDRHGLPFTDDGTDYLILRMSEIQGISKRGA